MKKLFAFYLFLVLSLFPGVLLRADVVILQNGKVITGTVLQQDGDGALVQMDYGTFRYPTSLIKDVKKEAPASRVESSSDQRIPNWARIISLLATNGWAHELKQIPATVIDNGVLKDVPYISFRCNTGGYEINIYGDLDNPSGIEIGAITYLVKNDQAKSNCAAFIASVLPNREDKKIIQALSRTAKDTGKRDSLTFETTMPDEPDAYGGWWVSVYDENLLAKARASGAELLAITQPVIAPKAVIALAPPIVTAPETTAWTASDLSYSRPTSSYSSGGGQVYVRGYYRKNGTYVHSYTRSSPHRR